MSFYQLHDGGVLMRIWHVCSHVRIKVPLTPFNEQYLRFIEAEEVSNGSTCIFFLYVLHLC